MVRIIDTLLLDTTSIDSGPIIPSADEVTGILIKDGISGKFALINDGSPILDCFACPLSPFVWPNKTRVFISVERRKMFLFVPLAESLENLFKLTWLPFWNSLLTKVDAEVAGNKG